MPEDKSIINENIKIVEIDGVKFYEKSEKIKMKVSDYGIVQIKGSDIEKEANIPIGFKIEPEKTYIMLKGYLNNKLIPNTDQTAQDSYGDIPTGKNVYDLNRLINNPVASVDHKNMASMIVGNWIFLKENKQGLQFKEILRPLDEVFSDELKDVIAGWADGWGKSYSIGGRWLYDWDKSDPSANTYILVKAILHEAAHVMIGADQWALSSVPDVSSVEEKGDVVECKTLEEATQKYLDTDDESYIDQIKKFIQGEKDV